MSPQTRAEYSPPDSCETGVTAAAFMPVSQRANRYAERRRQRIYRKNGARRKELGSYQIQPNADRVVQFHRTLLVLGFGGPCARSLRSQSCVGFRRRLISRCPKAVRGSGTDFAMRYFRALIWRCQRRTLSRANSQIVKLRRGGIGEVGRLCPGPLPSPETSGRAPHSGIGSPRAAMKAATSTFAPRSCETSSQAFCDRNATRLESRPEAFLPLACRLLRAGWRRKPARVSPFAWRRRRPPASTSRARSRREPPARSL